MAFQANAFQTTAFQVCVNNKNYAQPKYKRVWIPDKKELKKKVKEAELFLDDIKDKAEGFDDVLRYERKLSSAVKQFKESGGRDSDQVIYEAKSMARLKQILLSIQLFEDDMLEMLALLLLINEV